MEWLYGALAGLVALGVALWRAYRSGVNRERDRQDAQRQAEHAEAMGDHLDKMRARDEVRKELDSVSSDYLDERLRGWRRD